MKHMRMFVRHKSGESEDIERRFAFPGKNTGWLAVGATGNVWLVQGPVAYWICDVAQEGASKSDRARLVAIAQSVLAANNLQQQMDWAHRGLRDPRAGYRVGIYAERSY